MPYNEVENNFNFWKEKGVKMNNIGIRSLGVYLPYYYMERSVAGSAWGSRAMPGKRSLMNSDEDSVTMAVEATLDTFRFVERKDIDGLFFASTTGPYAEKSHATLISSVLDLNKNVEVADFNSSLRSSTAALRTAVGQVKSGLSKNIIVTASDSRDAYPKSVSEQLYGDAAGSLVIGSENVFATIDAFYSVQEEIVDIWRNRDDQFVRSGEGRFILEEGYLASMKASVEGLLEENSLSLEDINTYVFATNGLKDSQKLAKSLKIDPSKLADDFISEVGIAGTAQTIIGLIGALEKSNPGDKILLASYGNGSDAILLTVTEEINKLKENDTLDKYLDSRVAFNDYGRFLSFKGIITPEPGDVFKIPTSAAQTWREQKTYLKLYGSKCNECGRTTFPISRVCPNCSTQDKFEEVNLTERITKLFTFSVDYLAGRSDDPIIVQSVVEDEEGTRVYMNMTDFDKDNISIDMELEFTFRKIHNQGNFVNYYWKVRPLRRKGNN